MPTPPGEGASLRTPSGLWVAPEHPRPLAALLGLEQTVDRRVLVPPGSGVYLAAMDYVPAVEAGAGRAYDPQAWLSVLLCQYTREEHLAALAQLNHVVQHPHLAAQLEREIVEAASPVVLRTLRLVAHLSPADEPQLAQAAQRTGRPARALDPLACAAMLTHAVADGLGAHARRRPSEPTLGGVGESLAMELICSGAFTRQGNHGNLLARTLLLYRDFGARITEPLRASSLQLAEDALGMPLLQALAIGFGYYGAVLTQQALRANPAQLPPPHLESVAPGAVTAFLDRFASTAAELAAAAGTSRRDWQNLYLQERPLLRVAEQALVLDEAFLLERLTTGLFFLVLQHEGEQGGPRAKEQWRVAYGQMHEMLVEAYLAGFAPAVLVGGSALFDEHDLQRAYDPHNKGGGRADVGIDFGDCVVLAEAVSGQLGVQTRELGDRTALEKDLKRMVVKKARQLAGTFEKVTRDPQPAGAVVAAPATAVYALVVPGGQFPVMPVVKAVIEDLVRTEPEVARMLDDRRCRGLHLLDLRDLEHADAVRQATGRSLPDLLSAWQQDQTLAGMSLSDWLLATAAPHAALNRPQLLRGPLAEVSAAA